VWNTINKDDPMIRYLLGEIPDEERDRFEELYFQDNALHERLQALEEELVDSYVRGKLEGDRRRRFEQRYLATAEGRERVAFAQTLTEYISKTPPKNQSAWHPWWGSLLTLFQSRSPAFRIALAAAALVILLLPFWVYRRTHQQPSEAPVVSLPPGKKAPEKAPESPVITKQPELPVTILSLALMPVQRSVDGGGNIVAVPPSPYEVHFRIGLDEDDYPRYRVTLLTPEGKQLRQIDNLIARPSPKRAKEVVARFTSNELRPGDYIVRLSGLTPEGSAEEIRPYAFRIKAQPTKSQ
jgi:hypothetical protein